MPDAPVQVTLALARLLLASVAAALHALLQFRVPRVGLARRVLDLLLLAAAQLVGALAVLQLLYVGVMPCPFGRRGMDSPLREDAGYRRRQQERQPREGTHTPTGCGHGPFDM